MQDKIAIVGTGANGSCIAADLTVAGFGTTLIDQWPEHVDAMRQKGLKIILPERDIETKVNAYHLCNLCELNIIFDYIFIVDS